MSLYNISNFTTSRDPTIWVKTANTLSDGALGVGLPLLIWFIVFVALSARGLTKYALAASSFICVNITLPLVLIGLSSWYLFFVFILLTAIGGAILIYDKGY